MAENLEPKSISKFKGYKFSIPDYQRGYRWTSVEVQKLLEDLDEYFQYDLNDPETPPFYSMQPLVVFKKSETYEVLDGQQRLTTLYLILKYLNKEIYSIEYDTRKESKTYLEKIGKNTEEDKLHKNDNIDNYHIYNAYYTISTFLDKQKQTEKFDRFNLFIINQHVSLPDLKFIWYDITPEVTAHKEDEDRREKIFSRLNVGKIGLTNAELLKALYINGISKEIKYHPSFKDVSPKSIDLLKNQLTSPLRLRIANEWDMIEHALHNSDFWSFIYGEEDGKYETRIEFIFDNIVEIKINDAEKNKKKNDKAYTFDYFQKHLKAFDKKMNQFYKKDKINFNYFETIKKCEEEDHNTIDFVWHEVMDTYHRYQNWFEDKQLYHLIGYLRYLKMPIYEIDALRNKADVITNDDFIKELKKNVINKTLKYQDERREWVEYPISSIQYGDSFVKPVLVLFNVLSVMNWEKSELKFSFSELYNQSYDIEHIHSQHPKTGETGSEREDWIVTVLEYYSGIQSDIHEIPEKKDRTKERNQKVKEFYEKFTQAKLDELKNQVIPSNTEGDITAYYICTELLKIKDKQTALIEEPIFDLLVNKIFKEKEFDEIQTNSISNLALLDSNTNRGYKNSFFPIKRHWILERENNGFYIPPCTKNVFMKSYSNNFSDLMNWTQSDAQAYLTKIEEVINTCRV